MPTNEIEPAESNQAAPETDRRGFLKKFLAITIGGVIGLVPALSGLMVLLDPVRRKAAAGAAIKVTTLDALPKDGIPRKFPVLADRTDAWNKYPQTPIGAVYLRRTSDDKLEALNVVCPHAGCFVDYSAERGSFLCPCHRSSFKADGQIADPASPAPRGLDTLVVEVRGDGEVWVTFQNFESGRAEKVSVA